jgi:uncharacterized DUF497 family protein
MMKFEWDPAKNRTNQTKHGISFEKASQIWQGNYITVDGVAHAKNEERSASLGLINGRVCVAIWTRRNENVRIISVRRARKYEEQLYQEKF